MIKNLLPIILAVFVLCCKSRESKENKYLVSTGDLGLNYDSLDIQFRALKYPFSTYLVGKSDKVVLKYKNIKGETTYVKLDSLGNLIFYMKNDSLGQVLDLFELKDNRASSDLHIYTFFDKECYKDGDSVIIYLRAGNRIYEKFDAKVYYPKYPKKFKESSIADFRYTDKYDATKIDDFNYVYKIKYDKKEGNRIFIRYFCYKPEYYTEIWHQKSYADVEFPSCD